ncbi:peptide MFS transporter [Sphingomonas crusticola]|uniref:peptide MFS transporter n=1 Tax=Sphingomonas crusticola TaxID=1697973 RepID=UPI001F0743C9|nr:peptide MFS transporter [Sphingomonas crusticola]
MNSNSASVPTATPKRLFGHPPGLTILFLTDMWAEFSYFGLQALLVYYMTSQLGFSQGKSSLIYGIYGGAAFFSPFFGGIIADKWLGRTRSVVIGGLLMMLGHFAMAFPAFLFPALALVALGNGLFMPPLAVQVGALYADDDPRKAHAFSAYYMGINLGGLLAPLVCGSLGELLGWHWGFGAAGVGMFFGLVIYLGFKRLLPHDPGRRMPAAPGTTRVPIDARAVRLLVVLVAVVILFRIAYEQSGNVIALWVRDQTDRSMFGGALTIPATWFQAINPLLIILFTPLLIHYWGKKPHSGTAALLLRRMSFGCMIAGGSMLVMVAAAIVNARTGQPVGAWWVLLYFLLLTMGELLVIPVGLTLVNLLSPAGFAATAMGAWYIAKFLGSVLAGVMGSYWGAIPPALFFGLGAGSVLLAAVILRLMGSVEQRRG